MARCNCNDPITITQDKGTGALSISGPMSPCPVHTQNRDFMEPDALIEALKSMPVRFVPQEHRDKLPPERTKSFQERLQEAASACKVCEHPMTLHGPVGCQADNCFCKVTVVIRMQSNPPLQGASQGDSSFLLCSDCRHPWSEHNSSGCNRMVPEPGSTRAQMCTCSMAIFQGVDLATQLDRSGVAQICGGCKHTLSEHTARGCNQVVDYDGPNAIFCECTTPLALSPTPEAQPGEQALVQPLPQNLVCPHCQHAWALHSSQGCLVPNQPPGQYDGHSITCPCRTAPPAQDAPR